MAPLSPDSSFHHESGGGEGAAGELKRSHGWYRRGLVYVHKRGHRRVSLYAASHSPEVPSPPPRGVDSSPIFGSGLGVSDHPHNRLSA